MNRNSGLVTALWRYPVKSMQGEELNAADITKDGLLGDRAYALVDKENGKVASAKHPKKWAKLFDFRATFVEPPSNNGRIPAVRITLPDGRTITSDRDEVHQTLSSELGREAALEARERGQQEVVETTIPNPWMPSLEEYWPDIEGLPNRDVVTDEAMPEGTYFDLATVHILTTSTLDRLRELYPQGRFEVRRFRPNIVIAADSDGFVENDWIGQTLAIGDDVRLKITGPCPRCVMTTLPQSDLPNDPGILRTAAKHNGVHVGVYASVLQGGRIRCGDVARLA